VNDSTSLERLVHQARSWLALPAIAMLLVVSALIAPRWIREPLPLTLDGFAGLLGLYLFPAFLVAAAIFAPRLLRRRFGRIWPRVREAGLAFRGPLLVLNNGLLLQPGRSTFISGFYTLGGTQIVPSIEEAKRWTRPRKWKRRTFVRSSAHQTSGELSAIQHTVGASRSNCLVARYGSKSPEPNHPAWMARVTFVVIFPPSSLLDRAVAESGRIATYLEQQVRGQL
jgi:hypothetical protein